MPFDAERFDEQFKLPLQLTVEGQIATVATGTPREIEQRAMVLCATRPGDIDDVPDFGLADQAGRKGGADLGLIERQLTAWIGDPDLQVLIDESIEGLDRALDQVDVELRV